MNTAPPLVCLEPTDPVFTNFGLISPKVQKLNTDRFALEWSVAQIVFMALRKHFLADQCAGRPCQNGGTCSPGKYGPNCTCAAGYTGDTCREIGEISSSLYLECQPLKPKPDLQWNPLFAFSALPNCCHTFPQESHSGSSIIKFT